MLSKGSFEDFLYILIGIIWVAFSIYKGSKRKKQTQKQSTKQDQQQVDIPYTQEIPLSE